LSLAGNWHDRQTFELGLWPFRHHASDKLRVSASSGGSAGMQPATSGSASKQVSKHSHQN
jgi:hypothetical protein